MIRAQPGRRQPGVREGSGARWSFAKAEAAESSSRAAYFRNLFAGNDTAGRTDPQRNILSTLEIAGDQAERIGQVGADKRHHGDGGDCD